jgi:Histidine kinase-, DNA gyrase B-, and HSP90-like ATPase
MHATRCDLLTDLVQNAWEAGATDVAVEMSQHAGRFELKVEDNGCGMDPETLRKAVDPFESAPEKHPGRTVGLGLPFVKMTAEACGGSLSVDSVVGRGTVVRMELNPSHVDTPPLGDVPATLAALMNAAGQELRIRRVADGGAYEVKRSELVAALGDLSDVGSVSLMKDYFSSNEEAIRNED